MFINKNEVLTEEDDFYTQEELEDIYPPFEEEPEDNKAEKDSYFDYFSSANLKDRRIISIETEHELIKAVLTDPKLLDQLDFFHSSYFYDDLNAKLYDYAVESYRQGLTLSASDLVKNYYLYLKKEKAGIVRAKESVYIAHIQDCLTKSRHVSNPIGLARNIKNVAIKRNIVSACYDCITETELSRLTDNADELIAKAEDRFFNLAIHGSSERKILSLQELTAQSLAGVAKRYANKEEAQGVTSGFKGLDDVTNGFQKTDLIILAGRPSMGKTALAVNMAFNASAELKKKGGSALFFSLEMSAEQLTNRILSMRTRVPGYKIRSGRISQRDYDSMVYWSNNEGKELALHIDDSPNITMPQIRSKSKQYLAKEQLGIIFIDYLQLIQTVNLNRNFNRTNELSIITRDLKQLAKDLNIPIVVLSQLSRSVEMREDKRPMLSDLRESGSIEQDADIVMFIYRQEYYARRGRPQVGTKAFAEWKMNVESKKGESEIIISKHRNGDIADVPLFFDNDTTLFTDRG